MTTPSPDPQVEKSETLEEIAERIATQYSLRGQKGQRAGLRFAVLSAVRSERERCARLALDPYGDEVGALGGDEPKATGKKIARAIREGR